MTTPPIAVSRKFKLDWGSEKTPVNAFSESTVEQAALEWFRSLGYAVLFGPHIAPGKPAAERSDYREVLLAGRLRAAIQRLNHGLPREALEEAFHKVAQAGGAGLMSANRAFHRMLVDGVEVEILERGQARGVQVRLLDFERPIVVLTDCNDLDDQLFGTFACCAELLRQTPVQAQDRAHLCERLGHSTLAFTPQVHQRAHTERHRRTALNLEGLLEPRGERPVA
jgi:type I site-specific restriction-modification system R (restriction) subunit